MIVIADTSPLNYLIQIQADHLLPALYQHILIPVAVMDELAHPNAPARIRNWLNELPAWLEVCNVTSLLSLDLAFLDKGEREAIQLAQELNADLLLIDERMGRQEAIRRGLTTTGVLGVLLRAGELGLIDPELAYRNLISTTTFRTSIALESHFIEKARSVWNPRGAVQPQPSLEINSPTLIVHCDWSMNENRRWMSKAVLINGTFAAHVPELVGNLSTFIQRVQAQLGNNESALIGFDFPIGLPKSYAGRIGVSSFLDFLKTLKAESVFFQVCENPKEITLDRPFYPHAPGNRSREHLTQALDIDYDHLLRTCDHAQEFRSEAAALFWTLGANQVGKAAIVGWRDVLAPALRGNQVRLWPFDGTLPDLLLPGTTAVAETYPTEYYSRIFGQLRGSKTVQTNRAEVGKQILFWASQNEIRLSETLPEEILAGFNSGDDAFDAVIGLFGMLEVVIGKHPEGHHPDPATAQVEGWILGQP